MIDTSELSHFKVDGNKFYTIEGDGFSDCDKCSFIFFKCDQYECKKENRIDNKNVYFKEIK